MRWFTLLPTIALALSCTPNAEPLPDRSVGSTPAAFAGVECRQQFEPVAATGDVLGVLDAVERARSADLECGSPDDRTRICRALFALSVVDPAVHVGDPPMLARAADALDWLLGDAADVANPELAAALESMRRSNRTIADAPDDNAVAKAILDRATPAVIEPIDSAWTTTCG